VQPTLHASVITVKLLDLYKRQVTIL